MPLPADARRALRWRIVLLAGVAVLFVGFGSWALSVRMDLSAAVATIVGLLVSLVSLAVSIVQLFPAGRRPDVAPAVAAQQLGDDILDQWMREGEARGVRGAGTILPITWSVERGALADPDVPGKPWPAAPHRFDGDFLAAAAQMAGQYGSVGNGRLAILGEPGSGKTVLAMMLTVGLLRARPGGGPVPVLLSASGWDPVEQTLDDWVAQSLARSHYGGDVTTPRRLLRHELIRPVVDGLDELPEASRRTAVERINDALGAGRPIIVTCRAAEFEDVIRGGAPVLHQAPVMRVEPVAAADAVTYLTRRVPNPDRPGWDRVLPMVAGNPAGPIAQALTTPLMVSILLLVYGVDGPGPLVGDPGLGTRHAVEDHLLDRLAIARFRAAGHQDPERATRWLTFLAVYLHRNRERELAWWRLSDRLLPRLVVLGAGLLMGALVIPVIALVTDLMSSQADTTEGSGEGLYLGANVGILLTLVTVLSWYAVPVQAPRRLSWPSVAPWPQMREAFRHGLLIVVLPGVIVLTVVLVALAANGQLTYQGRYGLIVAFFLIAAGGVVLALSLAAAAWLNAPPERSRRPSPDGFLRHDRRSALVSTAVTAGTVLVTGPPIFLSADVAAERIAHAAAQLTGRSARPDGIWAMPPITEWASDIWGAVIVSTATVALLVAAAFLVTRAWPRYLAVRLYLAARRRLPWRLPRFLAIARAQGLLRESGGLYQFQHTRLQERLATRPVPEPAPSRAWPTGRRRAIAFAGVASAMLGGVLVILHGSRTVVEPVRLHGLPANYQTTNQCAAISADARTAALCLQSDSTGKPSVFVFRVNLDRRSGAVVARLPVGVDHVAGTARIPLAIDRGGDRVAVPSDVGFAVFDLHTFKPLVTVRRKTVFALAYDSSGRLAVLDERGIELFPVGGASPQLVATTLRPEDGTALTFRPSVGLADAVAVSLDGPGGTVMLADGGMADRWRTGHSRQITPMAFTGDGTTLVTASAGGTIRFAAAAPGASARGPLDTPGLHGILAIALPDHTARRVMATDGDTMEIWTVS